MDGLRGALSFDMLVEALVGKRIRVECRSSLSREDSGDFYEFQTCTRQWSFSVWISTYELEQ